MDIIRSESLQRDSFNEERVSADRQEQRDLTILR
jgi:hypothetical protein